MTGHEQTTSRRSGQRLVTAGVLALALTACVRGENFVDDVPVTPLLEGLYEFCPLHDRSECTPLYLFRKDDQYVFAARDGLTGLASLRQITPTLFMAHQRTDQTFFGYGAVRLIDPDDPAAPIEIFRLDCDVIDDNFGIEQLREAGVFDEYVDGDTKCRIGSSENYDALAKFVAEHTERLSAEDGKFTLTLIRADTYED